MCTGALMNSEKGNADAMYTAALCYQNGGLLQQDPAKACEWFKKAADNGYKNLGRASAAYPLSLCYEKGINFPQDSKLAKLWLSRAAAEGDPAVLSAMSGLKGSDLKKYNINSEEDIKKLKIEFDKNIALYGNDTSAASFLKFLGDKQEAMSQNITIAQYVQKRQAEEKRVKALALAEQIRQVKAIEEKRRNIKLTTMFVCVDKQGVNRDKGLAENLINAAAQGDHILFGYMITNSVYAQFCSQVIAPFNDMNAFNAGSMLYATRDGVDYYLISDAYKTWGVMGK